MTETMFGLFRHGQTDWNIDLRLQGTADIPMNETGREQVRQATARLAEVSWDVLLTSPLGRARESAEIVSQSLALPIAMETPLLLERAFGVGEGKTYAEWQKQFANLDEIPGAESREVVRERASRLLDFIRAEFQGQRVLAVSHGALIRSVLSIASNGALPPVGERLQNASLHTLRHASVWLADGWAPDSLK